MAFPIVDSCNERERKEDEEKFPNFSSPSTVVRVNYKDLIKKAIVRKGSEYLPNVKMGDMKRISACENG